MASIEPQRNRSDRSVTIWATAVLSLVLFAGLLALAGAYEISVGELPEEWRDFHGSLKNGELWYTTQKSESFPFTRTPSLDYRVNRLNLQTGNVSPTSFHTGNGFRPIPVWIGETLFVCAWQTVLEAVDGSLRQLPPIPLVGNCLFEFDGVPTVICSTTNGEFQFAHWKESQWTFGRNVLLPDVDRLWCHNSQSDRIELRPLTSKDSCNPNGNPAATLLFVEKQGQQYHLLVTDGVYSFAAYRTGFEFVDEDLDAASAMAPENAQHDVSGWEPVFPGHKEFHCEGMKCDSNGPLFISNYPRKQVVRRSANGFWDEVELGRKNERNASDSSTIVASPTEPTTYLITIDWGWSSAKVSRIEGTSIRSSDFVVPGFKYAYVERCARFLAEVLIAWAVHIVVLAAGMKLIQRRTPFSRWEFGHHVASLASLRRRLVALIVDALLVYVVVWLVWISWRLCLFPGEPIWQMIGVDDVVGAVRNFRYNLQTGDLGPSRILRLLFDSPMGWLFRPFDPTSDFLGALTATIFMLLWTKIFFEARYGVTPGKWLTGIRTVSSTLCPCGIGPALARNVLYALDLPFFLTPLPACVSLMLSDRRQRLGDRVADTVVIQAGSIREN